MPGTDGTDGIDGADGVNAYTTTSADFNVPAALGGSVTIAVVNTSWMVLGQTIVVAGPATFTVNTIGGPTAVTLDWVQGSGDVAGGSAIVSGAKVSPSGPKQALNDPTATYGTGGPQAFAVVSAELLSVTVTIPNTGKYLLFARVLANLNGATFAAVKTLTAKIRRTNNTAADLAHATTTQKVPVVTTLTYSLPILSIPLTIYSGTAGDILQVWGSIEALPGAGSVDAAEAELIAQQIS